MPYLPRSLEEDDRRIFRSHVVGCCDNVSHRHSTQERPDFHPSMDGSALLPAFPPMVFIRYRHDVLRLPDGVAFGPVDPRTGTGRSRNTAFARAGVCAPTEARTS